MFNASFRKLLGCLLLGCCFAASAQPSAPLQRQPTQAVSPPSGSPFSVEIHDRWMFVGTSTFLPSGILYNVHVFRRVLDSCDDAPCWQWYSILPRTPTPVGDGAFGVSMEFDGRTLMVGDPGDFVSNTGRVLVYELEAEQFVLKQELTVSTAEPSFGQTIALDGKQVAIATMNWPASGAIYLFKRQAGQWVHTERVTTQNGELEQLDRKSVV